MDFFKILNGGIGVSMSNFDRLWAKKFSGWPETELTGLLPLTFLAEGSALTDYRIYGTESGAGVQTENLWDGEFEQGTLVSGTGEPAPTKYRIRSADFFRLDSGTYTFSASGVNSALAFVYDATTGQNYQSEGSQGWIKLPLTFTVTTNRKIKIVCRITDIDVVHPSDISDIMLVEGSTAPISYVPFGYKIPILNTSGVTENEFDYTIPYASYLQSDGTVKSTAYNIYTIGISLAQWVGKQITISIKVNSTEATRTFISANVGRVVRESGYIYAGQSGEMKLTLTPTTENDKFSVSYGSNPIGMVVLSDFMIVKGSTAPSEYIPHRYTSNYDLFIGDSKLGAEDYLDYQEQKVYKLKEVHKDTVTINGIEWDILGYDHDTVYKSDNTLAQHSVTIQAHDCISELQFDAKEALFAFPEGLAAGTYHFTVSQQPWYAGDVGKVMQFTLANAIPADGVIVLGNSYNATMIGSTISVYASCSATTATETATISEGSDGTDLGSVGNAISGNTNSIQRALLGNNNYNESAIRQYLNSDGEAGTYWTPQNKWDRPPSWNASTAGFLRGFNSEFVSAIGKASKRTAKNTVSDGGGYIDTEEKIFLLSKTEVYAGNNNSINEGTAYRYFSEFSDLSSAGTGADSNRIKYRNNVAKHWWLRSPLTGYAIYPFYAHPSGAVYSDYIATSSYGVVPACCIVLDDIDTNPYLQSLFYKPTDPPAPLPAIQAYQGENTLSSEETVGEVSVKGKIKEAP